MCLSIALRRPADVLARGKHAGFEWIVTHNGMGNRCGYVRIPKGHPWHGRDDDDLDVAVHGGVTFGEADVACGKGASDEGWWVGFDTAHFNDRADPELPIDPSIRISLTPDWGVIRTQEYVESECRSLCDQARDAAVKIGEVR